MNQVEMLDEAKRILGVQSDYALSKRTDIPRVRISDYRNGKRVMDEYACFRIAEILGRSPSSVIAEVLATNEKNEAKRLYFQRFFTIAALWITLGLLLPLYSGSYGSAYAAGDHAETRANATYEPIMRSARRLKRRVSGWLNLAKFGRYFTCNWHVKFCAP